MTRRLLLTYLTLTAFVLVVLAAPLGVLFARAERRHVADQVRHDALVLALEAGQALQTGQRADLPRLAAGYQASTGGRVTIVDRAGLVLADSDPAQPGQRNFADRPEVAAALRGQETSGQRHSTTLGRDLFYAATPMVWRGQVTGAVRIVYPPSLVNRRIVESWLLLGVVALAVLAVAALAGKLLAGSVNR
ncbi:MAG TPA: sensor histidine kinase, partial [Actinomycetota bacterium]